MAVPSGNLELTGTLLVSDDFDRLRLLLVDEAPGGQRDSSAWQLRHACDTIVGGSRSVARPYELSVRPDSDGTWGVCTIVAPKRYRVHWAAEAAHLRGQRVRVLVAPRRYMLRSADGGTQYGLSLDLVDLARANSAASTSASTAASTLGGPSTTPDSVANK